MLRVRELFTKPYYVRNLVNGTMTTNSKLPLKLKGSRRFYAVWSDLQTKGADGNTLPFWNDYWEAKWRWMKEEGGAAMCINYLMNLDLSTFKAGQPPPVTDFLREIQDESKPAVQRTVEAFTENNRKSLEATETLIVDVVQYARNSQLNYFESLIFIIKLLNKLWLFCWNTISSLLSSSESTKAPPLLN